MKIKLDKCKLTDDDIIVYNKPKIVYIPLISGNDTDITILVNKGEYVYKGSIIGKRKGDFRIPIHSSVSGTVLDFKEKLCFNGKKLKCVVIENDFKEKIENKTNVTKNINKYSKDEFIEIIKENGIVGLGGAAFPTYVKYEHNKINTLIINAVESEPYITADYALAKSKCEEILEAIDAILEINKIDEAIIAIKKENIELKQIFDNFIGTYLKIKIQLVSNYYHSGWERQLIKEILNEEYDKFPIERGILVNNISTIYAIYEALKFNKPLIERMVTFSGECLNEKKNVLVKIGTPIKEILEQLQLDNKSILIAGGPMMGIKVSNDLVLSSNINCILALTPNKEDSSSCINCGKCVEVCPAKLSPVLIMKQVNKKTHKIEQLKKMNPNSCINCGLCSYICPSKIDVRGQIINAKKTLKGGK